MIMLIIPRVTLLTFKELRDLDSVSLNLTSSVETVRLAAEAAAKAGTLHYLQLINIEVAAEGAVSVSIAISTPTPP